MNGFIVVVAGTLDDVIVAAFDDYDKAKAYADELQSKYDANGVIPHDVQRILNMLMRDMSTIEAINIYDMHNGQVWEIHTICGD